MKKRSGPLSPVSPRPAQAQTASDWGAVAGWYDALVGDAGSEFHREIILPGVLRLLELRRTAERVHAGRAMEILDVACGQGVLCRKLARMGCRVTGIDAADPLIRAARERSGADGLAIQYLTADATKLLDEEGRPVPGLAPQAFDAITLVLAIQNISPLSPVWKACRVLLKPVGKLVIVMMHPCFRIPRASDWLWQKDVDGGWQARLVRRYLSSETIPIQTHPGLAAHGKDSASTPHFHRPLQAYINTLAGAGLLIDHIEEWPSHKTSQPGPQKAALDRARKEIPLFLALRARLTPLPGADQSASAESPSGRK